MPLLCCSVLLANEKTIPAYLLCKNLCASMNPLTCIAPSLLLLYYSSLFLHKRWMEGRQMPPEHNVQLNFCHDMQLPPTYKRDSGGCSVCFLHNEQRLLTGFLKPLLKACLCRLWERGLTRSVLTVLCFWWLPLDNVKEKKMNLFLLFPPLLKLKNCSE